MKVVVGQDFGSIGNYSAAFGDPWGVMVYQSLRNFTRGPLNYGSGLETIDGLMERYPNAVIQLGLYLVGDLRATLSGELDEQILDIEQLASERRLLLRIGYEFDNPDNGYDPSEYVRAFSRVSSLAPSAESVWHSYGPVDRNYWPGHADWCAISIFGQGYDATQIGIMPDDLCSGRKMIAESTPIGSGDHLAWLHNVYGYTVREKVEIWSYINCDWEAQKMWTGQGWGDSRLQVDDDLANFWRNVVLENSIGDRMMLNQANMAPSAILGCLFFALGAVTAAVASSRRKSRRRVGEEEESCIAADNH